MIKNLWIDTDIGGDCDDAGALAIANIAARDGTVNLLGMTFTTSAPAGPACMDAINTYFGNSGIPIGMTRRENFCCENVNAFQTYIARNFPNRYYHKQSDTYLPAEDAIPLIRRKLAAVPDGSVIFVCIGQFNNASDLLDSQPDAYSPFSGEALVRQKVSKFVVMGGLFGDGVQFHGEPYELEYNVVTDIPSAQNFVRKCPVPLVFCDFLAGYRVLTGGPLLRENNPNNPVTAAYHIFQGCPRESWDPLTVWYAIYGTKELFSQTPNGFITVQSATGDYYDNLNIAFSSKDNAPDIFFTESGEFLAHMASGKMLDLTPYVESGALDIRTDDRPDGQIELWDVNDAYRYDGTAVGQGDYYALIKDWSPDFIMWYNKSHIDEYNAENDLQKGDEGYMEYPSSEIPMTWDEFLDMSYKLRKTNRYGTMLDRVPYKHLMEWVQMTGSSVWTGDNQYFNSEDPNVLKAFQFFTDLQIGDQASAPVIGPSGVGSGEAFANGNVSFVFFGNWAYSTYSWDSVSFEIGYCPSPVPAKEDGSALTEEDIYAGSCGMIALAVNNQSAMKDEAIQFLNYYMTKGNIYMAGKVFNIPGNKAIANSDAYRNPEDSQLAEINQYFLNVANHYTHAIVYNKYIGQETFEDIVGKYMSAYLANPSSATLEKVLANIAEEVRREM